MSWPQTSRARGRQDRGGPHTGPDRDPSRGRACLWLPAGRRLGRGAPGARGARRCPRLGSQVSQPCLKVTCSPPASRCCRGWNIWSWGTRRSRSSVFLRLPMGPVVGGLLLEWVGGASEESSWSTMKSPNRGVPESRFQGLGPVRLSALFLPNALFCVCCCSAAAVGSSGLRSCPSAQRHSQAGGGTSSCPPPPAPPAPSGPSQWLRGRARHLPARLP